MLCCLLRREDIKNGDARAPKATPGSHYIVGCSVVNNPKVDIWTLPEGLLGKGMVFQTILIEQRKDPLLKVPGVLNL